MSGLTSPEVTTASIGISRPYCLQFRLHLAKLRENAQCLCRLGLVDPAHGKPDMQQHPVANAGFQRMLLVDHTNDVHLASDRKSVV